MPAKTPTSTSKPRKPAARRPSANPRKGRRKASRPMPAWKRNLLAALVVLVFFSAFYWFFIRPYAYRWKPCFGQWGYEVCIPCSYGVHGIDVSHYQKKIDWAKLARDNDPRFPLYFAFMKATEGGDLADHTFSYNFAQAREHGFVRGAYHYFIPRTDADKQADFFISTVKLEPGDLPPVLDVETTGRKSRKELQAAVKRWLDRVEAHYGVKPIIYTPYKFKMSYLNDSIFNTYPYWIAHYYVDSVRYKGAWHFWQHTDVGSVPGIRPKVDMNVFNGTPEQLDSLRLR